MKAYKNTIIFSTQQGFKSAIDFLGNEAPSSIREINVKLVIHYQSLPPYSHRRNSVERSICTWKTYFISGLYKYYTPPFHYTCRIGSLHNQLLLSIYLDHVEEIPMMKSATQETNRDPEYL